MQCEGESVACPLDSPRPVNSYRGFCAPDSSFAGSRTTFGGKVTKTAKGVLVVGGELTPMRRPTHRRHDSGKGRQGPTRPSDRMERQEGGKGRLPTAGPDRVGPKQPPAVQASGPAADYRRRTENIGPTTGGPTGGRTVFLTGRPTGRLTGRDAGPEASAETDTLRGGRSGIRRCVISI